MKRDSINYLMVGIFVLVMAVAFLVLLFAITGRSGPTDRYFVYYDNVAGLKFGTGVSYEGFRIGQVESIEPESTDAGVRYRLELSVAAGWRIPKDSVASVESSGLISAVQIDIKQGTSSDLLAPGDTLEGRGQSDVFAALNQAAGDFRTLSRDGLMPVLKNLNARIDQVTDELVGFRRDDLSPLVSMLHERLDKEVIAETMSVLGRLDDSARGLQNMLGEANQERVSSILTHADAVAVNLNDLVTRIEATREQMNGVLASLDAMVSGNEEKVTQTFTAARSSMQELDIALKTVNLRLGTILYNLEGSSRHMNEFARTIRENPARLLRNSATGELVEQ
jgi:phospholipid/cholesterol/gamma-HCH transport system substrate-binding protein